MAQSPQYSNNNNDKKRVDLFVENEKSMLPLQCNRAAVCLIANISRSSRKCSLQRIIPEHPIWCGWSFCWNTSLHFVVVFRFDKISFWIIWIWAIDHTDRTLYNNQILITACSIEYANSVILLLYKTRIH